MEELTLDEVNADASRSNDELTLDDVNSFQDGGEELTLDEVNEQKPLSQEDWDIAERTLGITNWGRIGGQVVENSIRRHLASKTPSIRASTPAEVNALNVPAKIKDAGINPGDFVSFISKDGRKENKYFDGLKNGVAKFSDTARITDSLTSRHVLDLDEWDDYARRGVVSKSIGEKMKAGEYARKSYSATTGVDLADDGTPYWDYLPEGVRAQAANAGTKIGGRLNSGLQMKAAQKLYEGKNLSDKEIDSLFSQMVYGVGGKPAEWIGIKPDALEEYDANDRETNGDIRKSRRREFAREIARSFINERVRIMDSANKEINERGKDLGAVIGTGGMEQVAYTAPWLLGPVAIALQTAEMAADEAVNLTNDEYAAEEDGSIRKVRDGYGTGRAIAVGGVGAVAETASEKLGGPIGKRLFKSTIGRFPVVRSINNKIKKTAVGKSFSDVLDEMERVTKWTNKKMAKGGFIEEGFEEYLVDGVFNPIVLDAMRPSDDPNVTSANPVTRFCDANKEFFKPENLGELYGGMLITMGGGQVVGYFQQRGMNRALNEFFVNNGIMTEEEAESADLEAKAAAFDAWKNNLSEDEIIKKLDTAKSYMDKVADWIAGENGDEFARSVVSLSRAINARDYQLRADDIRNKLSADGQEPAGFRIPVVTDKDGNTIVAGEDGQNGEKIIRDNGIEIIDHNNGRIDVNGPFGQQKTVGSVEEAMAVANYFALNAQRAVVTRGYKAQLLASALGVDVNGLQFASESEVALPNGMTIDLDRVNTPDELNEMLQLASQDGKGAPAEMPTNSAESQTSSETSENDPQGAPSAEGTTSRPEEAKPVESEESPDLAAKQTELGERLANGEKDTPEVRRLISEIAALQNTENVVKKVKTAKGELTVRREHTDEGETYYRAYNANGEDVAHFFTMDEMDGWLANNGVDTEINKNSAQVDKETPENGEIVSEKPTETDGTVQDTEPLEPAKDENASPTTRSGKPISEANILEKVTHNAPVQNVKVADLNPMGAVKQMKQDADTKTGVVNPIKGEPMDLLSNPIVVLRRKDGSMHVVTGRHRLDLYKRSGRDTIPARVINESDGWSLNDAHFIDALSNIVDGQGSIKDYVDFFNEFNPTDEQAKGFGFTRKGTKANKAFRLFRGLSPVLRSFIDWRGEGDQKLISVDDAAIIAEAVPYADNPKNEQAHMDAIAEAVGNNLHGERLRLFVRGQAEMRNRKAVPRQNADQGGFDFGGPTLSDAEEEAIRTAENNYIADKVAQLKDTRARIERVVNGRDKGKLEISDKYAKELGITDKNDAEQLKKAIDELDKQLAYWSAEVLGSDQKAEMKKALGFALGDESTWDAAKKKLAREIKRIEVREANKKTLFDAAAENGTISANEKPQEDNSGTRREEKGGSSAKRTSVVERGVHAGATDNEANLQRHRPSVQRVGSVSGLQHGAQNPSRSAVVNALHFDRLKDGSNEKNDAEALLKKGVPVSAIPAVSLREEDDGSSIDVTNLVCNDAEDCARLFQYFYTTKAERTKVVYLGKSGEVLGVHVSELGKPGQTNTMIDYIFSHIPSGCAKIVVGHNHPSGNAKAGNEDKNAYENLRLMCSRRGVKFDGIVTDGDQYSAMSGGYKPVKARLVDGTHGVFSNNGTTIDKLVTSYLLSPTLKRHSWLVGIDAQNRIVSVVQIPADGNMTNLLKQMPTARSYAIACGEDSFDRKRLIQTIDSHAGKSHARDVNANGERRSDADFFYIEDVATGRNSTELGGNPMAPEFRDSVRDWFIELGKKPTAEKSSAVSKTETTTPDAPSDAVANAPDLKFMRLIGKDGGNVVIYGKGTFNAKDKIKALGATAWSVNRKFVGWILDKSQVKAGTKLAVLADANGVEAAKAYEVITGNANAEKAERKAQREAERARSKEDAEREKFQRRSDEAVSDDDARKEAEDIDFAEPKEFPADGKLYEQKTADESPAAKREAFGRKRVNDFLCAKNADGSYVHPNPSFAEFAKWMDGLLGAKAEQARRFYASWYTAGSVDAPADRILTDTAQVAREHNEMMGLANRGKDGIGHRVANVVQEGLMPKPQTVVNAQSYNGGLDADQQLGVNLALDALKDGNFILADDTGFGKTRQILAIADQFKKANKDANILVLTENEQILAGSFADDSRTMGVNLNDFTTGTYTALGDGKFDDKKWDLVILDEAHNVANVLSARGGNFAKMDAAHVVFSTATPMDKPTDADYFISRVLGIPRETVADMIGYRYVDGKYGVYPVPMQGMDENMMLRNLVALRNRMIAEGRYVRREYPFLGSFEERQAELAQQHAEAENGSNAYWDYMADRKKIARYPFVQRIEDEDEREKMIESIRKSALQQKVKNADVLNEHYMALSAVNEALAELEKNPNAAIVIVGEQVNDRFLTGAKPGSRTQMDVPLRPSGTDSKGRTLYRVDGSLPLVIRELEKAGYGNRIANLFGVNKKAKTQAIVNFNNGTKNILVMTKKSGGTGVNLDDRFGNRPRTVYLLSPEYSAKVAHQLQGRFSRKPTMSNTRMVMFANPSYSYAHRNRVAGSKVAALNAITSGADSAIVEGREAIGNEEFFETKHLYTGSAADYEKPSLVKVGTGEGSQVYGWGLYASDRRGVAEGYVPPKDQIERANQYRDYLKRRIAEQTDPYERERLEFELKQAEKAKPVQAIYEQTFFTNRAPGDESHLLKWYDEAPDKMIDDIIDIFRENGYEVKRQPSGDGWHVFEKGSNHPYLGFKDKGKSNTGDKKADRSKSVEVYYNIAADALSSEIVSKGLAKRDWDGIKYPVDSYGGKTVKDGDKAGWNYVSFRDDNIRIDRKFVDGKEVEVRDARDAAIEKYLSLAADAAPVGKHPDGSPCYTQGCRRRRIPWKNIEKHNAMERAQMKFDFDGKSAEQKQADEERLRKHDEEFHPDGYREGDGCLYRKVLKDNGNDEKLKTAEWGEKMIGKVRMASSENLRATIKKLDATRNEWLIGIIKKELEYRHREEERYMDYLGEMA